MLNFITSYKRWIVGAFAVLVITLFIWVVGPLLAIADAKPLEGLWPRVMATVVVILVWLAIELGLAWRNRRLNRAMLGAIAGESGDARLSKAEQDELATRFRQVLGGLGSRTLGSDGQRRLLYQLPWYMFIGPPGSGKTTAIRNSGLRFPPLAGQPAAEEIRGVGGTRNCDWLFTEDAVLIDTAGRYTTQDSNAQVDQSAWQAFLKLLRRYRPRQPINGIFVALSIQDLLESDEQARSKLGAQVRMRVEELQHELGLRFPVYVVVTKCDLISGFTEFFASLDAEQRNQVWGMTFGYELATQTPADVRKSYAAELPLLVQRLNSLLLSRLAEERDTDRRAALYPFPQQFASIGPLIGKWLDAAFGDTRYAQPVAVRGLYFTSGTQFGAPIDRVMAGIARSLDIRGGTSRAAGSPTSGKSYFIRDVLEKVVFPEAGLASHNEALERRKRRTAYALGTACVLGGALLIAAWLVSYNANADGLAAASDATRSASKSLSDIGAPTVGDLPVLLDALDAVLRIPPAVHDPVDAPPFRMAAGLYQGDNVDEHVQERYRNMLQTALMPRIALQLELLMQSPGASAEQVYAALKTYLMMYDDRHMDTRWFMGAVTDLWRSSYGNDIASRARPHLETLVGAGDVLVERFHPKAEDLIASARAKAASASLADRALSQLRLNSTGQHNVRISEVVGPSGIAVFEGSTVPLTEVIPGFYTAAGYRAEVKPAVGDVARLLAQEETWVMGKQASGVGLGDQRALEAEVLRRYFSDARAVWRRAMEDVRLRRLDGLQGALSASRLLSESDSPLKRLVNAVATQTRMGGDAGAAQAAADAAERKARETVAQSTTGVFGGAAASVAAAAIPSDPTRAAEQQFEAAFADIRRLAGDGVRGEIDAALSVIAEISNELVALQQRMSTGQGLREMPPGLMKAASEADRFPRPINQMIKDLTAVASGEASGGIRKEMQAGVGGASAVCRRAISGRYPFTRNAVLDVGVQDFVTVFKAGGELDSFFNSSLAPLVDRSGTSWRFKGSGPAAEPVSLATLRQFQNAEAIRTAFLAGGATAQVVADVTLTKADAEVVLEYDGVTHRLKPGDALRLTWPAKPNARLTLGGKRVVNVEGAWALFKLVDAAQLDASSAGDRLLLTFSAAGIGQANLELRTGSAAFNPFRLRELQAFSCPKE